MNFSKNHNSQTNLTLKIWDYFDIINENALREGDIQMMKMSNRARDLYVNETNTYEIFFLLKQRW